MDGLTDKIRETYRQAAREIRQKLDRFTAAHRQRSAQMLAQVKAGKLLMDDYQKWLQGQVFVGERWREKLDDITRVYVHADEVAREVVGRTAQNEFVRFANQTARDIQHDFGGAVSFDMYDSATVERLLQENPQMLPEWHIDEPKDYTWNEQRVQNAVTQGIIQGEPISDIADRLCNDLATSNARKMDNFARTAVTGAQNAGRIDRMHQAQEMGIRVRKKWLASHDDRVRDSHAELDGTVVDVDEDFVTINGNHIAYPGDPSAPPEEVYNCRCTLLYVYPDFDESKETAEEREEEQTEEMHEEEREEEETTLEDLFGDLWDETPEQQAEREERERQAAEAEEAQRAHEAELQRPGQYGVEESDYPDELQLTASDEKRLEAITHYWDEDFEQPRGIATIRSEEVRLAQGNADAYSEPFAEAERQRQMERLRIAEETIAERRESGYTGMSREESARRWGRLQRELASADEAERGDILNTSRVGEQGIQYWQRERKAAERELERLAFDDKLYRRLRFAQDR